jgi:hypothetical protein
MAIKSKKTISSVASKSAASKTAPAAASKAPVAKAPASGQPKLVVSHQELEQRIRDRAYFNYINRGACQSGCAKQDWIEAEKQVKKELRIS